MADGKPAALIGRKVGMTRLYTGDGANFPATIIEAGPCFVSQIKTAARREGAAVDGYDAVQLAFEEVEPRRSTMPVIGHDHAAGLGPRRVHKEFRVSATQAAGLNLGERLTVEVFDGVKFVDVTGRSKGKGFAGTMKRWNYKGQPASHGTERKHRSPGSIASHATNRGWSGRPKKGKKMSGHLGDERVTVRSLDVLGIDKDKNLLIVKGPVPGPNHGLLIVKESRRLSRAKQNRLKAS
jgi:large subunit ribosomal protein L3